MGNSLLEHLRRVVGRNFGLHHLWQDGQHVASFSPEGMAPQPSAELWNRAEAAEVRKNARVAREVLVALRAELSPAQRRELTLGIAQALADRYGTAGTLAVHTPDREGDQRNHHAHILMTTRRLEPSGALGEKTRELDDVKRGPLGTVTRLQANNDRRQLTADRDELGAVSAQIIDIEQARAAVREVEMAGKTSALIIEKATRIAVSEAVSGALAVVLGIVLLVVPSPDQIAALRAEVVNLEARGGKATLTVCGDKKRLCAEIDTRAPEYGERGQFRILKGY